jgi:hypothetical protein
MTSTTRRSVLAAVGVGLTSAGCLTDSGGTDPGESTTSKHPTDGTPSTTERTTVRSTTNGTTTDDARTTTADGTVHASNQPDPNHRITLNNDSDAARTIRVRVVRTATGETVFVETRELPAGTETEVYTLAAADPDGIEPFRVCGQLVDPAAATVTTVSDESDARDCETLQTSGCYGHAHVTAQEDDSLQVIYSIC